MGSFMEGVKDCQHSWQGIKWTQPNPQLKLQSQPFDQCRDCDVKVWGRAIDAPPTVGFGFGDQGKS
jgi:hypothetical protein